MIKTITLTFITLICWIPLALGQTVEAKFEKQMIEYEYDVVRSYNELQKFLTEHTANEAELVAFERLITIYVDRILEIYNTLNRLKGTTLETYRGVAARALIFRALTFLERAESSTENYEKACNDYKRALLLYQKGSNIPIINKQLPHEVWIGKKLYTRLADLLDDKGKGFHLLDHLRKNGKF